MSKHNPELAPVTDKFFYNVIDRSSRKLEDMRHCALDPRIYYKPTAFPLLDHTDTTLGSAFASHRVPTSAYYIDSDRLRRTEWARISLDEYIDTCDFMFQHEIARIYREHDEVILSFSGGIDSMVLLSYILGAGLLDRTMLLIQENLAQDPSDPTLIRNDTAKSSAIKKLERNIGSDRIIRQSVTAEQVVSVFNRLDYNALRTYNTVIGMEQFEGRAIIYGHHGNQVLLHKDIFLQEIVLQCGATIDAVNQLLVNNRYYSRSMRPITHLTCLDDQNLKHREWTAHNGNYYYSPLGLAINLCRRIDYSTVDPLTVIDARVGRELISRNADELNDLVTTEGLSDGDSLIRGTVRRDLLDPSMLEIPTNMEHDPEGLRWLRDQLEKDEIEFNSLTTAKMCCMLSKSFWNVAQR